MLDNWHKYGYLMFPQQRAIYEALTTVTCGRTVLEAGCGVGLGTALLYSYGNPTTIVGTDKVPENIKFSRRLYPWVMFNVWDFTTPWSGLTYDVVICVEAIEHVENVVDAVKNLIGAATKEVWISTPNGKGKPKPPSNPFHVRELTVPDMMLIFALNGAVVDSVEVYSWEDLEHTVDLDTDADPLVYRIKLRN